MKRLTIRLSSLGDVILASAPFSQLDSSSDHYFMTSPQYLELFEGAQNLKLLSYQKKRLGGKSLFNLAAQIANEDFDLIIDLQGSIRTRILRFFVFLESIKKSKSPRWKVYRKQRIRRFLFVLFKKYCPKILRPQQVYRIWNQISEINSKLPPRLEWLKKNDLPSEVSFATSKFNGRMVAVMPSSIWPAKEVNLDLLCDLFESNPATYIILGTSSDQKSAELFERLSKKGIAVISGIQKWPLKTTASVLAACNCYIGADTGLAHLSEAVGTPAIVLFGPTRKDFGFGPHLKESVAIETELGCSPCGKDGRYCFRLNDPFLCQRHMPKKDIENALRNLLERSK